MLKKKLNGPNRYAGAVSTNPSNVGLPENTEDHDAQEAFPLDTATGQNRAIRIKEQKLNHSCVLGL